jgi:hypothetical protein
MNELAARQEFRHPDLRGDRFELYGNQVFGILRFWGAAMFGLGLGALPALLLFMLVSKPLERLLGAAAVGTLGEWAAILWIASSFPIAVYFADRRWKQVHRNYMIVASGGFELLRYPRKPMRVPWTQVRRVHDPSDYSDPDNSADPLEFETEQGNFKLSPDHWGVGEIRSAVEKYVPVVYKHGRP